MFITRATRHDKEDVQKLLESYGWSEVDLNRGVAFIARDGEVIGCVRLIEVAPQQLVVDDVLVADGRRGQGIGADLMRAAMNSRGGTLYLCCHPERVAFYERLGFADISIDEVPREVVEYWREVDDYPTPPDHVHRFLKAR
ncbi:MAG TPA: GNAT family N-acetyltransferase [Actinomycetota bacterium]|nr:GNAT family N-acetyltransferase [Actinomycetota bacterium]